MGNILLSTDKVLKRFGRYLLLRRLASGSVAGIYLSRLASLEAEERFIVIKRIHQLILGNSEFINSFFNETKQFMALRHPNIIHHYHIGKEEGRPYIAMEYVDGKNLKEILFRLNDTKIKLSVPLVLHIIDQVCAGLSYCHQLKDAQSGKSLQIIHRNINPKNILVAFQGSIKIIDFGTSKPLFSKEDIRRNVLKGKSTYLSPEQMSDGLVDARADVFSMGIILWELLTGRKLFSGSNALLFLKAQTHPTHFIHPPSVFNPQVPEELDEITLKALALLPDERFQKIEDFQYKIHHLLRNGFPQSQAKDLASLIQELFKNDIVRMRDLHQSLNQEAQWLLMEDLTPPSLKRPSRVALEQAHATSHIAPESSDEGTPIPRPQHKTEKIEALLGRTNEFSNKNRVFFLIGFGLSSLGILLFLFFHNKSGKGDKSVTPQVQSGQNQDRELGVSSAPPTAQEPTYYFLPYQALSPPDKEKKFSRVGELSLVQFKWDAVRDNAQFCKVSIVLKYEGQATPIGRYPVPDTAMFLEILFPKGKHEWQLTCSTPRKQSFESPWYQLEIQELKSPSQVLPVPKDVIETTKPDKQNILFKWTPLDEKLHTEIEIEGTKQNDELVLERSNTSELNIPISPGTYRWRLRSRVDGPEVQFSDWGPWSTFELRDLKAPEGTKKKSPNKNPFLIESRRNPMTPARPTLRSKKQN